MVKITEEEFALFQKLTKIWYHASQNPEAFFICGEAGESDEYGLPEKLLVCPAEGLDGFALYTKETEYNAPGY